ncbi:MAG: ATP-dependent helicase [Nostocaceae cyanobacterium]|nr:ATP-dependent helicase [Nostocaceae cyanobacterium]
MKSHFDLLYEELNKEQKEAINRHQNTIVLAGPGSGKTRMICLKAAKLYSQDIGVACISFGNAIVEKIKDELLLLGVRDWEKLYVGTIHHFCLHNIIYPFLNLYPEDLPPNFGIASNNQSLRFLYQALINNPDEHSVRLANISELEVKRNVDRYYSNTLIPLRRSIVSTQDVASNKVIREYDSLMISNVELP